MGEDRGIDSRCLRTVPEALVRRYLDEGWWTDDSLGDLVADGLAAMAEATFAVYSDVRPWREHHRRGRACRPRVRRLAAGPRASGRATSSCSSCPTGSRPPSPSGARPWPVPSSSRSCTSTAPRSSATSSRSPDPRWSSPPTASATTTTPPPTPSCSARSTRRGPSSRATDAELPAGGDPVRHAPRRDTARRAGAGRPRLAGDHRLHLGHDARSEGRHPLASHDRLRGPAAQRHVARAPGHPRSPVRPSATSSGCSTRSCARWSGTTRST